LGIDPVYVLKEVVVRC